MILREDDIELSLQFKDGDDLKVRFDTKILTDVITNKIFEAINIIIGEFF